VIIAKKAAIEEARKAMDSRNRAGIAKEFATFLKVTMPSPIPEDTACQTMRPLEIKGGASASLLRCPI
jgi:hypothetical protein